MTETDEETNTGMNEETYLAERNRAIESHNNESQSYDKLLITLGTGAFGLSFTFLKLVVPEPASTTIWLLTAAWFSLIASVVGSLLGRLFSQYAHKQSWLNLDKKYLAESKSEPAPDLKNGWNTSVWVANWASAICLIVGVTFLTVFATENIKIEASMTDKKPKQTISKQYKTKIDPGKGPSSGNGQVGLIVNKPKPRGATEAPSAPITTSEQKPIKKSKD